MFWLYLSFTIHQGESRVNRWRLTSRCTAWVTSLPSRYAPDTAYHPYARGVHSRHAPDTNYPYACVVPSRHGPDTAYPYACVVPSRHPPDTASRSILHQKSYRRTLSTRHAYHPYACVVPSRHHLSLRLCGALPTCSRHHLSLRSRSASQHAPNTTYPYASVLHP
ncbi:hypothetical protein O181_125608 [Austropuccinia psidii MF-1]|uniref:Uncharacterized protein n=1 Tax=Austropuccinia psidii MF-1 TaxID=1389203 RepID=A0A9Q3KQX3_9BASI|nr:hypothetical protein [Austropuccinia psidii MF-1]